MMLKGENSREVVKRVKAKVEEINASTVLPNRHQNISLFMTVLKLSAKVLIR